MGAAVAITRVYLSAGELRKAARKEKDSTAARRILALALVMEGSDRRTAAESCGMDRQTLRDWVHRYNAEGLAGLRSRQATGPRSRLTREQQAELAAVVGAGPDPECQIAFNCARFCRNAAGRGHQPTPGERVPALCVRHVDGADLSSY